MSQKDRKIRYAVVGAGNIAQVAVLPAFANAKENSQLVAVISGDAEKRKVLADRYQLEHSGDYSELETILSRGKIDAVYIAVPNSGHREFTERAARAGVHVLCEKPMAETVEDCAAMIAICREHDVRLMIAYRLHFEEANLRAIELVQTGKLGKPRIFTSVFSQQVRPGDVRTKRELAGGAVFDMGVYPINAARYLFGAEPEEVFATSFNLDERAEGVDETTTAILRFAGGRVAQLTASLGAANVSTCRIVGTLGDLRVEPCFDMGKLEHHLTIDGKTTTHKFAAHDQFAPELIAFSSCVLRGSEPEASGEEGLADVRIVQAILESARSGKAVRLPPFERSQRPNLSQLIKKPAHPKQVDPVHAPAPALRSE
jgi:predicted dehydrogenase